MNLNEASVAIAVQTVIAERRELFRSGLDDHTLREISNRVVDFARRFQSISDQNSNKPFEETTIAEILHPSELQKLLVESYNRKLSPRDFVRGCLQHVI